jgi:hypothetical protein
MTYQDGAKRKLLCGHCEQLMSEDEGWFAKNIFWPYVNSEARSFAYDYHLTRYCSAQSLRVLLYLESKHAFLDSPDLNPSQRMKLAEAVDEFRQITLLRARKPSRYQHHILFLDTASDMGAKVPWLPKFLNHYMLRALDSDCGVDSKRVLVYSKLASIALFTFIYPRAPKKMTGTRIHGHGTIGTPQHVGDNGLAEFICSRAEVVSLIKDHESPKRQAKLARRFSNTKRPRMGSEYERAAQADEVLRLLQQSGPEE